MRHWQEISRNIEGRSGKQCRERYINIVDPDLNKEKWTVAEDLQLMELHSELGNRWVQIQRKMPGRTDNDIKNRYNSFLRRFMNFEQYMEY